jgi:hypothetical protein
MAPWLGDTKRAWRTITISIDPQRLINQNNAGFLQKEGMPHQDVR